jgi:Ca2+-binding EF-hand superfamily protein
MSGISGLSGGGGLDLSVLRQNAFKQIDTNGNGKVSKDEFVSGRPKGVSESQAAELFGKIDTKGTGEVTQSELESGFEKNKPAGGVGGLGGNLSSDTLSALLAALDGSTTSSTSSSGSDDHSKLAQKIFDSIDSDQDGKVTKDEFVSGRPKGVSESQASDLFSQIDSDGKGSIDESQFASSLPSGPPPFATGDQSGSGDASGDLVSQLLSAINSYTKNAYSGNSDISLTELLKA